MGVSGSGKSSVARALAEELQGVLIDADDYHPAENIHKMRSGKPLSDKDREPWLCDLNQRLRDAKANEPIQVLACSALKESYRQQLRKGIEDWKVLFLHGDRPTLKARLEQRSGHFMPGNLLDSQLADLEEPMNAIRLDIRLPVDIILKQSLQELR